MDSVPVPSAGSASLQTGLHVALGLGRDHAALGHAVRLGANHLQVQGTVVAVFVQNANVAQQIDVAAPVGLVFRIAGSFLTAPAIPDVDVLDPLDYGRDGFDGILVRAVDVAKAGLEMASITLRVVGVLYTALPTWALTQRITP